MASPEGQDQRLVSVIGEEPVVGGPQRSCHRQQQRLVSGSGYLEIDPALALEGDLPVVESP